MRHFLLPLVFVLLSFVTNLFAMEHASKDLMPTSNPLEHGNISLAGGINCTDCCASVNGEVGKEVGQGLDITGNNQNQSVLKE